MAKWDLYGTERRDDFDARLTPEYLEHELWKYQETFGEGFSISDLLMLKDIQAKGMIAEAINDVPEFLVTQIAKCKENLPLYGIEQSLNEISENLTLIG